MLRASALLALLALACCASASVPDFEGDLDWLCSGSAAAAARPLGCRLWSLCEHNAGGDQLRCQHAPASLLATACSDLADEDVCKRLASRCAGNACEAYQPLVDVPASAFARLLQEMSHEGHSSGGSGSSDSAPQETSHEGHSSDGSSDSTTTSGSSSSGSMTTTSSSDPCISDPTKDECAGYRYPKEDALADVHMMCGQMPNMVGCTLQQSCNETGKDDGFCSAFSLLGAMCVDMPNMSGCRGWVALCSTPGSAVRQCDDEPPPPGLVPTNEATDKVLEMCGSHSMAGCETCSDRFLNCPHPLATLAQICWEMSGMSECDSFYAMCESDAGQYYADVCNTGEGGAEYTPPMTMWFHQRVEEVILFREWVPRSTAAYVASWVAIFVMAVAVQGIKALRTIVETQWVLKQRETLLCHCGEPEPELPRRRGLQRFMTLPQLHRNAVRTVFTALLVTLELWLMLIVMLFNIGLFLAVVTGYMLGALLFGHVGEAAYNYQLPAGAKDGPGAGLSITTPVELPPPDLTKNGCCSSECV